MRESLKMCRFKIVPRRNRAQTSERFVAIIPWRADAPIRARHATKAGEIMRKKGGNGVRSKGIARYLTLVVVWGEGSGGAILRRSVRATALSETAAVAARFRQNAVWSETGHERRFKNRGADAGRRCRKERKRSKAAHPGFRFVQPDDAPEAGPTKRRAAAPSRSFASASFGKPVKPI